MTGTRMPIEKRCVKCGLDLAGLPRVRDGKGLYVCREYARTHTLCERANLEGDGDTGGVEDLMIGLEDLAAAESEARGEHCPIIMEPAGAAPLACPVCGRSFAPASEFCSGCGYRREIGVKSSMLLKKTKTEFGSTVVCPKCGYDMGGGTSVVCSECGSRAELQTARAKERRISAAVAREAYTRPIITFVVCIAVMLGLHAAAGGPMQMAVYAGYFPISVVFGWLVYTLLCVVMLGFDAPQHLIVLRLAAVFAGSDVAFALSDHIPIPILPWVIALLTYLSLLTYFLDMDLSDAMLLAVATFMAKSIAVVFLLAWAMGMFA